MNSRIVTKFCQIMITTYSSRKQDDNDVNAIVLGQLQGQNTKSAIEDTIMGNATGSEDLTDGTTTGFENTELMAMNVQTKIQFKCLPIHVCITWKILTFIYSSGQETNESSKGLCCFFDDGETNLVIQDYRRLES